MKAKIIKISLVIMLAIFILMVGYVYTNLTKKVDTTETELVAIINANKSKLSNILDAIEGEYSQDIKNIIKENNEARSKLKALGGKCSSWEGHSFLFYIRDTFFPIVEAKEEKPLPKTAEIEEEPIKQIEATRTQCGEFVNDHNSVKGVWNGDTFVSKVKHTERPVAGALKEDTFSAKCGKKNDIVSTLKNKTGHIGFVAWIDKERCYYLLDSNRLGKGKKDVRKVCSDDMGLYVDIVDDTKCLLTGVGNGKIKWNDELKALFIEKTGLNIFEEKKDTRPLFTVETISQKLSGLWYVSTYYTPVRGQKSYVHGSYDNDYEINCLGNCLETADRHILTNSDIQKVVACPKGFPFGTKLKLTYPDNTTREVMCRDRGGAIKNKRLDLWVGIGNDGRNRVGQGSSREVKVEIIK